MARQYYFHRFYDFQPDLNVANPAVRDEMEKVIGFWLNLGIAGYPRRRGAVPDRAGERASTRRPARRSSTCTTFRKLPLVARPATPCCSARRTSSATRSRTTSASAGCTCSSTSTRQPAPLARARARGRAAARRCAAQTAGIPGTDQWANFLRNHDELDLGRLADDERARSSSERSAPKRDAALRPRHPAAARADARRRPAPARARVQPAARAARHAGRLLRRRDRHGRRPLAAGARGRAHADAVVAGANAGFSSAPRSSSSCRFSRGAFAYRQVNVATSAATLLAPHLVRRAVVPGASREIGIATGNRCASASERRSPSATA